MVVKGPSPEQIWSLWGHGSRIFQIHIPLNSRTWAGPTAVLDASLLDTLGGLVKTVSGVILAFGLDML